MFFVMQQDVMCSNICYSSFSKLCQSHLNHLVKAGTFAVACSATITPPVSVLPYTSLCALCVDNNTTLTVAAVQHRTPLANKPIVANIGQVVLLQTLLDAQQPSLMLQGERYGFTMVACISWHTEHWNCSAVWQRFEFNLYMPAESEMHNIKVAGLAQ